jgi:hypothetical protein
MIMQKESKTPTTHLNQIGLGAKKTSNPKKLRTHPNIIIPMRNINTCDMNVPNNSRINSKNFFIIIFF